MYLSFPASDVLIEFCSFPLSYVNCLRKTQTAWLMQTVVYVSVARAVCLTFLIVCARLPLGLGLCFRRVVEICEVYKSTPHSINKRLLDT